MSLIEGSSSSGVLLLNVELTHLALVTALCADLRVGALHRNALDFAASAELAALLELAGVLIDDRGEVGVGARIEKISIVVLGQWEEVGDLRNLMIVTDGTLGRISGGLGDRHRGAVVQVVKGDDDAAVGVVIRDDSASVGVVNRLTVLSRDRRWQGS